jgi:hypothetical protein
MLVREARLRRGGVCSPGLRLSADKMPGPGVRVARFYESWYERSRSSYCHFAEGP